MLAVYHSMTERRLRQVYILIVEDERRLAQVVRKVLEEEGHTVDVAHDGEDGLAMAMDGSHDVIVLDILLPGIDGIEVSQRLRAGRVDTPILLLTALNAVDDRVRGLDAGADDYLPKPFAFQELLARLRALGRRRVQAREPDTIQTADLVLDLRRRRAERAGKTIELSPKEFALLEFLLRNEGRVVTRSQILDHVWGYDYSPDSNLVDVYVTYLRRKVDRGHKRSLIRTVRGAGYALGD
ncbi:MAG: response regulator transcription factor [Chloroflexi bacterium]|nr:response regulator transcription factor [Chloroflexota bacterium]